MEWIEIKWKMIYDMTKSVIKICKRSVKSLRKISVRVMVYPLGNRYYFDFLLSLLGVLFLFLFFTTWFLIALWIGGKILLY